MMELTTPAATRPASTPTHSKSRLLRIVGWFAPSRVDLLVFFCCVVILMGLLVPLVQQFIEVYRLPISLGSTGLVAVVAGCITGVAVAAGWRRIRWKSGVVVLAACASTLLAFWFAATQAYSEPWGGSYQVEPSLLAYAVGKGALMLWTKILSATVVLFLLVLGITRAVAILIERTHSRKSWIKLDRTRLLIGLAVLLFVVGTIQNIFFPRGFFAEFNLQNLGVNVSVLKTIATVFVGVIAAGVLVLLPGYLLTRNSKRRWKFLTLFTLLGVAILFLFVAQSYFSMYFRSLAKFAPPLLYESFFLTSVILVSERWVVEPDASNPISQSPRTKVRGITIWSLIPVGLVLCFAVIIFRFDFMTLVGSRGQDWKTARIVKTISRESNGQVTLTQAWGTYLGCNFSEDSDPRVLDGLNVRLQSLTISGASFKGLTPDVDTSGLRGQPIGSVVLMDSRVTSAQLQDLTGVSPMWIHLSNVDVVDPASLANVGAGGRCVITASRGHRIDSLLRAIAESSGVANFILDMDDKSCDQTELDAIVELSQKTPVSIDDDVLSDMVSMEFEAKDSMRHIMVNTWSDSPAGINDRASPELRYVLENDLHLGPGLASDDELFWDLAFAKNQNANPNFAGRIKISLSVESMFKDHAERFHWKFGENADGRVTDLFLPFAESLFAQLGPGELTHFGSLETLSFDAKWLTREDPQSQAVAWTTLPTTHVSLNSLDALPKLKRLDLGAHVVVDNSNILELIPKIEHLQIAFDDSIKGSVDFRVCKDLKSLVYFGTPPKSTTRQLAALGKLESVIIVDAGDLNFVENSIRNIENSISGVDVKVVPEIEFAPATPRQFQNHVENLSARIRKKYLDQETP